jgi:hypothetical protein
VYERKKELTVCIEEYNRIKRNKQIRKNESKNERINERENERNTKRDERMRVAIEDHYRI